MAPLLEVEGLRAGYGKRPVLAGVSLTVDQGELVALLGHNGAGKSTMLKAICGLLRPTAGVVRLRGTPTNGRTVAQNIAGGVCYVPQGQNVFPDLTVRENLEIGVPSASAGVLRARRADVYALFPKLAERERLQAGVLSGGEQQMMALGRALMVQPALLLLDEPSIGLAPPLVVTLLGTVRDIAKRLDIGVLMVEQKTTEALEVADRGYILRLGAVALEGPAERLRSSTTWWHLF